MVAALMSGDLSLPVMLATGILPGLGARRAPVPAWHPSSLFEGVMGGFWFDFTDADKLRQTSVGIPPVAAASDPVGLAFDASRWGGKTFEQMLAEQPELRGDGAIGLAGTATAATYNTGTGEAVASRGSNTSNQSFVQWSGLTTNGAYLVDVENTGATGMGVRSGDYSNSAMPVAAGQRQTVLATAAGGRITLCAQSNNTTANFTVHSIKHIPGNHASQSSSSLRPTYQVTHVRGDGSDDRLITAQNPTLAGTLIYAGTFEAASDVAIGATGAGGFDRCMLRASADGYLQAAIGDQASDIIGATDIRGVDGVYAVRWGGDGEAVKLTRGLTVEYAGVQEGSVTTAFPFLVGAVNAGGSATGFLDGKMRHCLFVPRFITDDELSQAVKYFS
jgi:hypothetical protein